MPDVFAGRFELIDPIGAGGTGTVWRAWDRRLERLCAAKVLRQRHAGALLRFVREQGLRLDHPNILSPYSWAADDDQALLAMDLVGGGAVSNLLADFGPLPDRYAAELLAQLLGALVQVHAAGLVHRDIKPANLLLEATGTRPPILRLSDFGIALSLGEPRLTHQGALIGTPGYLAPETLAGSPPAVSQDLYAVGVTAWQLLTGEEPPTTHPLPAPAAPTPLWTLIEPLLSDGPEDRPSAESALATLAALLADPLHLPAQTADEEPIEVFDHLPPLPPSHQHLAAVGVPSTSNAAAEPTGSAAASNAASEPAASAATSSAASIAAGHPASAPATRGRPVPANPPTDSRDTTPAGPGAQPAAAPDAGRVAGPRPGPAAEASDDTRRSTPLEPPAAPRDVAQAGPSGESPAEARPGADAESRAEASASPGGETGRTTSARSAAVPREQKHAGAAAESRAGGSPSGETSRSASADAGVVRGGTAGRGRTASGVLSRRVVVGVLGIVVVAGAGGWWLLDGRPEDGTPSSGDSSVTPTPSVTPSETPPVVPTGPVTRVPNAAVTLGGGCGWQEAGSVETTADGTRVECRQQGSGYRWVKVS